MRASATHPTERRRVVLLAVLMGVLLSGVTVLTASRAAFSAATDNTGNVIASGSVTLTDDDSEAALFDVTGMAPGDVETGCILVTYEGTIPDPSPVVVYSGGFVDSATLADHLDLTIEEGTGAEFGDCSGFTSSATVFDGTLAGFDAAHTDYSTGVGSWDPASTPESRSYRITVELDANAPDTAQGQSITDLAFVWEVQS